MERYFYSTELVTFLFCLIIFMFVIYNKPKRTKTCSLCLTGVLLLFQEMSVEGVIYLYTKYSVAPLSLIVSILLFIHIVLHTAMMTSMLLYVDSLSLSHRIASKKIVIGIIIAMIIYTSVYKSILSPNSFFDLVQNNIFLGRYIFYLDAASIIATTITMIYIRVKAKEFPRGVTHMMLYSMPVMLFVEIMQLIYHNRLFHGIIYLIPLMILYFFYHNNPYDQVTGYQDVSSFESMFQILMNKKKPFHFIYIQLPKLKDSDYLQNVVYANSIGQGLLARTCRQLEYRNKYAQLYRVNEYTFAILLPSRGLAKDETSLADIKDELFRASREIGPAIYFYAGHFEFIDSFENYGSHLGQLYVMYTMNKHTSAPVDTWFEVTREDYASFISHHRIEQELLEMSRVHKLDDNRVVCYAQPIYDIKTGTFRTAEALMRMQIDGKMIYPDLFIPLAEKHECIHDLTLIMLNKVCKYIKANENELDFDAITINCSSKELSDNDFYMDIRKIVETNNVNPSRIRIELTESAMFENYDSVSNNIEKLSDYGIKFYLDDFGTGYSNFERIITCPLHTIKFDKGLLYRAFTNPSVDKMITTMIKLFKENNFHVLVEGVEDDEQKSFAESRGFEAIQGYYFSKPQPIEKLGEFFNKCTPQARS